MADFPLLRMRREPRIAKRIPGRRPLFPKAIPVEIQASRHQAAFDRIEASRQKLAEGIEVSGDPAAATPDRALVFEVIGRIDKFAQAARSLGFEWLAEDIPESIDASPDEDEASSIDDDDRSSEEEDKQDASEADNTGNRLYLTMPTLEGLDKLLALWRRYKSEEPAPKDAQDWWKIFGYLADVRVWSVKDRIDPFLTGYISNQLFNEPGQPVKVELDLWYRASEDARAASLDRFLDVLRRVDGALLDHLIVEEIAYHGVLISIPSDQAAELAGFAGPIATADMVMIVRAQSLYRTPSHEEESVSTTPPIINQPDSRPAIAALLDGYPVQNHDFLRGRIDVEEVDITATDVPGDRRFHGTAMASLILHGDLSLGENSLTRMLKVVPILAAPQHLHRETTPVDKLPLAMVYRAVVALKEGIDGGEPLGPEVVLVNHSVCDRHGPFVRRPTAWAKLIDFLSVKYGILFIISAGNIEKDFPIREFADSREFLSVTPQQRETAILRAIEAAKGTRGILSPAEAVNAVTVGAVHADAGGNCPPWYIEPYVVSGMTNLCSALGLGINRGIKPDFVENGGRQVVGYSNGPTGFTIWGKEFGHIGQLAASPDLYGGSLSKSMRSTGTSNAAALTTRSGMLIADALEAVVQADGENWLNLPARAVLIKALLAHGCEWGEIGDTLNGVFPPLGKNRWARRRENITRFLGFGKANRDRVVNGEAHRVTLIADDLISPESLHEYRIPIPAAMLNNREVRRIVMTLAWSTPIHPSSIAYRGIALDIVDAEGKKNFWKGVKKQPQPHPDVGRRGTLNHLVLEGKTLQKFADPEGIFVGIQARALHADFAKAKAPYALAVTLEVAQSLRTNIHAEVSTRIQPKVRARTRTRR